MLQDPSSRHELMAMYDQWPFFRACIDNAELALAKTDLAIAEHYAHLAGETEQYGNIAAMIVDEFRRSRAAVLELTRRDELLDTVAWLKESIRVRNRYIDPLNLIQVELLRRAGDQDSEQTADSEELRHLTRLTISGLAAGMRTSG
jgi:phosphoenolpyruvate carboxylase